MTMKIQAMLDWSPEEKAAKAKEWAQSLFTLRLQKATGQLENPMKIKELRKDIARLKTAQHMGAVETAAAAAHEVAHAEGTEEKRSVKPKAHAVASGKGAKKRAAAHKKKTAAAPSKGHSPSKKSSAAKGKPAASSKSKSAPAPKSKKK